MIGQWSDDKRGNLSQRFIDKVRPDVPLNTKIDAAKKKLDSQIEKLETIHVKLKRKHDYVFSKIVEAQKSNNVSYAKLYASELCEIRKMTEMVSGASLSMKQVQMRLDTVSELGDIVVTLSPCMSVIKGLGSLGNIMPDAAGTMQDLSGILNDVLAGSSVNGANIVEAPQSVDGDVQSILDDAQRSIEDKTRSKLPDIPAEIKEEIVARHSELI